jgi:PAS domain S-box-containing protein
MRTKLWSGSARAVALLKAAVGRRSSGPPQADADEHIRLLDEAVGDVIARVGPGLRIDYITPSCTMLYGWTPDEMIGRAVPEFILPEDHPAVLKAASGLISGKLDQVTVAARSRRKDGSVFWGRPGSATFAIRRPARSIRRSSCATSASERSSSSSSRPWR